jgi:hypothetical protein
MEQPTQIVVQMEEKANIVAQMVQTINNVLYQPHQQLDQLPEQQLDHNHQLQDPPLELHRQQDQLLRNLNIFLHHHLVLMVEVHQIAVLMEVT